MSLWQVEELVLKMGELGPGCAPIGVLEDAVRYPRSPHKVLSRLHMGYGSAM